ncbi:MAG: TrkH family potassium uptake protein [Chlorobium sp.]|nr:TrkH family potassium uptake protein [Chlorobium sp.]MCW8815951.1 TrkH family potassium uptake protein [Chlorobium sp.]MCW8819853.1 TrkH family potassium uptake protein [Ignavibacteriaceae bacterium]
MNFRAIYHVLGALLILIGCTMLLPLICALIYKESDVFALLLSVAITISIGLPLWASFRKYRELTLRDGIFIVTVGWILVSSFSALPFIIHGSIPSFTDAFFEMISGYTTTGATVLNAIEAVPHGLLFWRSMTSLIGGMGFIMVAIIILPLLGVGGMQLYKAEADPGQVITGEKILPRVKQTAVWLWGIYLSLNLIQTLLMWIGGMPLFDALCNSFATVSTSGYSPKNSSIGHYNSAWIDWVTILFMFLGGMNFMMHYQIVKKDWEPAKNNTEFRWYLGIVIFFSLLASFDIWQDKGFFGFFDSLRYGTFQVVSILTTTGFTTDDYELWPQAAQMIILIVCFIGASSGSTSSGIKIVHFEIMSKHIYASGKKFLQPLAVIPVKINGRSLEAPLITIAYTYFVMNIFFVLLGAGLLTYLDNMDFFSSVSAVISCLFNIGPGFGEVGPTQTYAHISSAGKWFLSFSMLTGRLEMFTVMVMFYPYFWKK